MQRIILLTAILFQTILINLNGQNLLSKYIDISLDSYANPSISQKQDNGYLICSLFGQVDYTQSSSLRDFNLPGDSCNVFILDVNPAGVYSVIMTMAVETADKGILIGGGFDSIYNTPGNVYNIILLKLDSLYNIQWSKIIYHPFANTGIIYSYSKLRDNGYLINNSIRTDSLGNIIWLRRSPLYQPIVLQASNGNLINAGGNEVSKKDSVLNGIWTKKYGNISINSGIRTYNNEYVFCGLVDSSFNHALFFLKIDSSGNILNYKRSDYTNWDNHMDILQLSDNTYEILAMRNNQVHIVHLDSTGDLKFSGIFNNSQNFINPNKIFQHSDSVFTTFMDYRSPSYNKVSSVLIDVSMNDSSICGFVNDTIPWRNDTLNFLVNAVYNSAIPSDTIIDFNFVTYMYKTTIIDYCSLPVSSNEINKNIEIQIFPNPTKNEIHFSTDQVYNNVELVIYDQFGYIKLKRNYREFHSEKLVLNYPPMLYFMTLKSDILNVTRKFVIID